MQAVLIDMNKAQILNGRRERNNVRLPAPVQIAPELPTVTALYSLKLILRRNLVGTAAAMQTLTAVMQDCRLFGALH